MMYLYHSVPKNLQGNILYPLNALKEKHFDIYEQQVSKYVGREHITQQRIPICLVGAEKISDFAKKESRSPLKKSSRKC